MTLIETLLTALLTEALTLLPTYILLKSRQNWIKQKLFEWGSEFKNQIIAELMENPEIVLKILEPVLKKLAKDYGVPEPGTGGQGGSVNLFGIKLPSFLVQMGMEKLLGAGKKKAEEAVVNVFG